MKDWAQRFIDDHVYGIFSNVYTMHKVGANSKIQPPLYIGSKQTIEMIAKEANVKIVKIDELKKICYYEGTPSEFNYAPRADANGDATTVILNVK